MSDLLMNKTKPKVLPGLEIQEEKQVILHCEQTFTSAILPYLRVWPSTYLLDTTGKKVAELVHVENITLMPEWKSYSSPIAKFTLFFSALPQECDVFKLQEYCGQQDGAMKSDLIQRNNSDVYNIIVY